MPYFGIIGEQDAIVKVLEDALDSIKSGEAFSIDLPNNKLAEDPIRLLVEINEDFTDDPINAEIDMHETVGHVG